MKIGIDIGGTNTDAVLVGKNKKIVKAVKVPTTSPLEQGFQNALVKLLDGKESHSIEGVYVGTTHATNALLQCEGLYKVGVIRLAGHHPTTLPPAYGWPQPLHQAILAGFVTVEGGYDCDGRSLSKLEKKQITTAAHRLLDSGAESLAICGVFSPLYSDQETEAADWIQAAVGSHIPLSLSHHVGGIGWIERENGTILNASLMKVMRSGFENLLAIVRQIGLKSPLYLTQNNGSLITLEEAIKTPVLTISAGPTNSFIGGVKLAHLDDAIVVDIGGTSTDVGVVHNGFPRRCLHNSSIGGVSLNFPMPDVLSIALGGGSHVAFKEEVISIGPQSSARKLFEEAIAFGGCQLTLTDIAIAIGQINVPGTSKICRVSDFESERVMKRVVHDVEKLVKQIEAEKSELPIILVGGGSSLLPVSLLSSRYVIPDNGSVANAYGAALAEVATTVTHTVCIEQRENAIQSCKEKAMEQLIMKGVNKENARIVDIAILPYFYMPDNLARITVTMAGKA